MKLVTRKVLFRELQKERAKAGLPPIKNANSISRCLAKKNIPRYPNPKTKCYHLYPLELALQCLLPKRRPNYRFATPAELESGEYIMLTDACNQFRAAYRRMVPMCYKLSIKTLLHPKTGRLLVHVEQFQKASAFRDKRFLERYVTSEQLAHIVTTRPTKTCWYDGMATVFYYCPELSHLGAKTTAYHPKHQ